MNKIVTLAISAVMAITLAVHAPTQAHAGAKENALVAGLVVGAAAAALVYAKSTHGVGKKQSKGTMLKRNGGGYISVSSCKRKGMIPEFGYCVEND